MIKLNNYARPLERSQGGTKWYQWKVFVDAPQPVLNTIARVEYILHPTFPEPRQIMTNAQDKFSLETAGWGEFTVQANVFFQDGHTETASYWLDLEKGWPSNQ